jgi:hypothetical protein
MYNINENNKNPIGQFRMKKTKKELREELIKDGIIRRNNFWGIIVKILKGIGIFLLMITVYICSGSVSLFVPHELEDFKGSIILKETPDSVGSIPIIRYDILKNDGGYEEISINYDDDFYNIGDTIK